MAIRNRTRLLDAYGLDNAIQGLSPQPVIGNRAPTTSDTSAYGTVWVWPAQQEVWILSGISNALANWILVSQGGSGSFTSLTVNPGPVNMLTDTATAVGNFGTGAGVKTIAVGSSNTTSTTTINGGTGAGAVLIQANTGNIDIIGGAGSTIGISDDAAASTVNIGTGAAVKTVTLGSTNTTSTTVIECGTTTGSITLAAVGNITVSPITATAASPTAGVTANHNLIVATFTGFSTAAAGTQAYTITSSKILATSGIFVTVTCVTAGASLTVTGVTQAVGSIVVNTTNNGASAVAGNVIVNVWIIS